MNIHSPGIGAVAKWKPVHEDFYALPIARHLTRTEASNLKGIYQRRRREALSRHSPTADQPHPPNASTTDKMLYDMVLEGEANSCGIRICWTDAAVVLPVLEVARKHEVHHPHSGPNLGTKWVNVARELNQLPWFRAYAPTTSRTLEDHFQWLCKQVKASFSPTITKPAPHHATAIEKAVYEMLVDGLIYKLLPKEKRRRPLRNN